MGLTSAPSSVERHEPDAFVGQPEARQPPAAAHVTRADAGDHALATHRRERAIL